MVIGQVQRIHCQRKRGEKTPLNITEVQAHHKCAVQLNMDDMVTTQADLKNLVAFKN